MFRFLELTLHGWDLWPELRIRLDRDVILVTGPNGSGKTTLLDALRQVLGAPQLSSHRRLQHYLRRPDQPALIRAVVSNAGEAGEPQPFRKERIVTPEVTLACALLPASGGTPEKRFLILPGRAGLDEIRSALKETARWYPPERYRRALEQAGVTRSLLRVLAIEQGRTNQLAEIKPRDLFQRVLDMMGDKDVLDRYREARNRYEETGRELTRQEGNVQRLQVQLTEKLGEVRRLDEWEAARDKVRELEARLPAVMLQGQFGRRDEVAGKLPELRTKVRNGETEIARLSAKLSEARREMADAEKRLGNLERDAKAALDSWGEAGKRAGIAGERVARAEKARREAATLPEGDLGDLDDRLRAAVDAEAEARLRAGSAQRAVDAAMARVRSLEAGRPVFPQAVTSTLEAVRALTPAKLLADTVEIENADLAEAAEAALGDARFCLVVENAHVEAASLIAREHGFPGPVWGGATLDERVSAGALGLAAGAPAWLPGWLERVRLSEDGCWEDERGAWVVPADGRVLGHEGIRAALERAQQDLRGAEVSLMEAKQELKRREMERGRVDAALKIERRRQDLLVIGRDLEQAEEELESHNLLLRDAKGSLDEVAASKDAAVNDLATRRSRIGETERLLDKTRRTSEGERASITEREREIAAIDGRIAELEAAGIEPELRARVERRELADGEDTVRGDLERARREHERLGEPPPREVRAEARLMDENKNQAMAYVARRREEAEAAKNELGECRRRYLDVLGGTLRDYRSRARSLAERAGVTLEMELPRLEDDDRSIDEAAIRVSMGFDGKTPAPLGDPSFSGGQQVIMGMILLMAMAETEGHGFFMLDEPFAHLSLDRVDDVGRFLKSTRAQFILTAPTTLDRGQLDPASLVIVLYKKRSGEDHAPPPSVLVA